MKKLLIALLACALAAAVASAPAAAAPTASNERALFRRSCADCDPSAYCEFAHPGAPPDHVACVSQGTDDGHALYRRYVSPRTFFWSIGGSPDDYAALTAVRYIEPAAASPVWTDAPALSVGRGSNGAGMYSGMANALGSKIYVYGGTDSVVWFSAVMVSLDASNLAAGWTSVALPSVTRNLRYNGVTAELGGVFYYIAGFNANSGNAFVTTTESYEPGTNTWTSSVAGATLPSGVGDTTKSNRGCAVSAAGSLWYMRNGHLLRWTPGDAAWTSIPTPPPPGNPPATRRAPRWTAGSCRWPAPPPRPTTPPPDPSPPSPRPRARTTTPSRQVAWVCLSPRPFRPTRCWSMRAPGGAWGALPSLAVNTKAQFMTTVCSGTVPA